VYRLFGVALSESPLLDAFSSISSSSSSSSSSLLPFISLSDAFISPVSSSILSLLAGVIFFFVLVTSAISLLSSSQILSFSFFSPFSSIFLLEL